MEVARDGLLIFIGIMVLWVILTGKTACAQGFWNCMVSGNAAGAAPAPTPIGAGIPAISSASFSKPGSW